MHTLLVKPMNKGVFSLTCVAGGLFHDGIFGKSFRVCIESPWGKLSTIGGYFFSFEKSLYTFWFFTSLSLSGGVGGGLPPSTGAMKFEGSETCVHKKYSEKKTHKATQSVSPLQKRLGIIATGERCAFGDGSKKKSEVCDS
jgi:hypothetical protein